MLASVHVVRLQHDRAVMRQQTASDAQVGGRTQNFVDDLDGERRSGIQGGGESAILCSDTDLEEPNGIGARSLLQPVPKAQMRLLLGGGGEVFRYDRFG